jgi:hypothetical protein
MAGSGADLRIQFGANAITAIANIYLAQAATCCGR